MLPIASYSGAARRAIDAARIPGARTAAEVAQVEALLRHGDIDRTTQQLVGGGVNGQRHAFTLRDAANPSLHVTAVEKPRNAQAAQEELGWRVAKELGVDHLVPAVQRRENGAAMIELRPGGSLSEAGILTSDALETALARGHDDLPVGEAYQVARAERQLLGVLDYVLANSDRHAMNGLHDARAGVTTFIDFGHSGRGTALEGASKLTPSLRLFQAGDRGGTVELDQEVVDFVRARLTPAGVRAAHARVFDATDIATPDGGTSAARRYGRLNGAEYREGMVARLEQVLTGRYSHVEGKPDVASEFVDRGDAMRHARGAMAVRAARHMADW